MNAIFISFESIISSFSWSDGAQYNKDTIKFLSKFSETAYLVPITRYEPISEIYRKTYLDNLKRLKFFTTADFSGLVTILEIKYFVKDYNIDKFVIISDWDIFKDCNEFVKTEQLGILSDESKNKIINLLK